MTAKQIAISVVIPTRNRADLLQRTLQSLDVQSFQKERMEIIVVDNGSTDHTMRVIDRYAARFNQFRSYYVETPGLHVGRNLGLQESSGEIIVYIDDDIIAFPAWLETIVSVFAKYEDVALVGGNNLPHYETSPPHWVDGLWMDTQYGRANGYYSLIDFGHQEKYISSSFVWGCNYAVRKKVLHKLGGFNPDGMPRDKIMYRGDGESDVSRRIAKLGYKTYFHPDASVYHHVPASRMNVEYIVDRSYAQGISDSYSLIRSRGHVLYSHLLDMKVKAQMADSSISDVEHINTRIRQGYLNGYFNHHVAVYRNQTLFQWIMRQNYLGENGVINPFEENPHD